MLSSVPFTRDLVFVGGGHAHALVLRAWGMKPLPGARLTLINPAPTAPYTGMLPGHIAGHYPREALEIDLVRLCRHAGARFIQDRAVDIDQRQKHIKLQTGTSVGYDIASIDVGVTAAMNLPGFTTYGIGAKPLDCYAEQWRAFLQQVSNGQKRPTVAVIGGGVAGCELAMAMAFSLRSVGALPEITVVEAAQDLNGMGPRARSRVSKAMADLGIAIKRSARVAEITEDAVVIADQPPVPAQFVVGAAGASPHAWVAKTTLPQKDGFIKVSPDLRVAGDEAIFAVGDCADMPFAPRPKAGVFAVRAAPVLHHNLRAALIGTKLRRFRPQKHYLKLISLGDKVAIAEKFGVTLSGSWLWRVKDRIDRAFMNRLGDLPAMKVPVSPGPLAKDAADLLAAQPLCGGCGSKVSEPTLAHALKDLDAPSGRVMTGSGDDAAVIQQTDGSYQVISTDHLRAFIQDPRLMTRIAAFHALGDVWAMGAQPEVILATIILPQMSEALQARTLGEITHTIQQVCAEVDVQLVGGHTTVGAELTIGFTVTGKRTSPPVTIAGGKPGDVLVLTRPLGSGVLLAADMQGNAFGPDVMNALEIMGHPQLTAANALAAAHAMTDVTGFGLAGHAAALARSSGVDVELWHNDIPIYPGARALADRGIASSLAPANRLATRVAGAEEPLLYDPQTAGGLLAAMPWPAADQALTRIAQDGGRAHIIGQLRPGSGKVRLI
ncbi:MAG: selenide, water dikinase SelD [Pseudomonadota bacterium]